MATWILQFCFVFSAACSAWVYKDPLTQGCFSVRASSPEDENLNAYETSAYCYKRRTIHPEGSANASSRGFIIDSVLCAVQSSGGSSGNSLTDSTNYNRGPYFDTNASKNVTALLGKTAYLNCRVKNLTNRTISLQVSWVRHRDVHLLTVGRYTYTSDQRFRAIHQPHSEDWTLQIKYPQHRDSGIYECQVSSTPHLSHYIHLTVIEPDTEIVGGPELFIDRGSTINLTCVVRHSPEPPAYIYWNHNDAIISYSSSRGGVSVATERGETSRSVLLIQKARPADSGNYQCNPSNARPANVTVHVLNGEHPEAMQHGGNQRSCPPITVIAAICLVLLLIC